MLIKEDILENITGVLSSDKPTHAINIPIGWIYQAMQQYAEAYHQSELLKLNKSDVISSLPSLKCTICGYDCGNEHHANNFIEVKGNDL